MSQSKVLVVGGGIAGVSIGSELAVDHEVVVLEAETALAMHSTGRSAALFLEGYGPEPVEVLTRASRAEFAAMSSDADTPELLTPRGVLLTAWEDAAAVGLAERLSDDLSLSEVGPGRASELCPVLRTGDLLLAGYDPDAKDIDVMGLHAAYVRLLRSRGGQTVTRAKVVAAERLDDGWRLTTADHRTWQGHVVVNAAGAWGDAVAALVGVSGAGLAPRRRTVVIASSPSRTPPRWPLVADAAEAWYFKPEGGSLLLSPADEAPAPPGDVKPEPIDIARVLEKVNSVTTLNLSSVQTSWAGLRTFTHDRVPVVGPHPQDPTVFSFVGQGGYGIQIAPALAKLGADLLRSGETQDQRLAELLSPRRLLRPHDAKART